MLDASSILAYSTNFIGAFMNYRKPVARRNRKGETKNSGNSQNARQAVLKARAVRNNANFKEAMFELNEYKCPIA